jgi:hypothetical protein
VFCFLPLLFVPALHGQTAGTFTGGAGLELSTISFRGVAGGLVLYGAYNLSPRFTLGVKFGAGSDTKQMASVEGAAFFRWYFLVQGALLGYNAAHPRRAFFIQAGAGGGVYSAFIGPDSAATVLPQALGEAAAGMRFYFLHNGAPVFLEPFVRYAYPSGFGAGFCFGG